MRSREEVESVLQLIDGGANDCEVSRITRIPRSTVRDWRRDTYDARRTSEIDAAMQRCREAHDFLTLPPSAFTYLLGMYLGDGYLARCPRGVWHLRISTDARYSGIIQECRAAMEAVMPGKRAHLLSRSPRCVNISMYSKHWTCLFPQHGAGRKHERPIHLQPWQEQFVNEDAESFLRGLIHSDGCRVIANDRGVKSVRYHFSNRSEDIKKLFCESLDSLGVPWTRPSDRQIAVYRKDGVARLDQFIGPKR